ncbi:MAG TPA: DUF456 domain-containing protein [Gemmatimonadaceae bacterium]|nr:DUF456 domain-containing protein [Gemmatimonadaceae bacterium]
MQVILLAAIALLGLVMIPFGLPGTLVMFCGALGYYLLVPGSISLISLIGLGVLMAGAEGMDWVLTARFTKKYGGSRRAGWGAIIGGMIGAFLGVPVPVVGSIIGAFAGAFVGAFVFEWSREGKHTTAARVAWGALIGRAAAAALKVAVGFVMAVWMIAAAMF